ncbi:MAG: nicotinate (nicotinamide) nucleotide adenylyltransferase [Odoribacteraceae bacterium]|jgi:nicotinate-nucleotide adenylyltransferase|nr:nicotinate (nicotinamide) nucleotide adenylyltransferase [Odoribacteraceae bacterium]
MTPVTGLFFGSFNPFHEGHLAIARYLLARRVCREVWFVVSPLNPFKGEAGLLPADLRLDIARTAVARQPHLVVSDAELDMPLPSYTANTLEHLAGVHRRRRFGLVIGADNYRDFRRWWRADEIIQRFPLIVYPRPGAPIPYPLDPPAIVVDAPLLPVSSSLVREKIARGEDVSALVPPAALPLIMKYYAPPET